MINFIEYILICMWYLVPAYFANMAPVFFSHCFKFLALPVDFRQTFKGQRVFGDHKTLRGFIVGIGMSLVLVIVQKFLYTSGFFKGISLLDYSQVNVLLFGFLMGFGALFGDLIKSFFKRQVRRPAGSRWFPFDQIDFVLGAILITSFYYLPQLKYLIGMIIITPILHITVNHIGYYLKIRNTKW